MTTPLRILLADDSVTVRRLLNETLSSDSMLEVCHAARDGQEALAQFPLVQPDVVVLDVEMPVMDGIETVIAIRKLNARVPIIMFSSLTTQGGEATLDALTHGATDYATKPSHVGHLQDAVDQIRKNLIPMIKHWGQWYQDQRRAPSVGPTAYHLERKLPVTLRRESLSAAPKPNVRGDKPVEIIAIGVSTGGPSALADVLKLIPKQFPIPIVIAQHMPPLFTGLLAERLNQICPLSVNEAHDNAELVSGQVWIAPGNQHLIVEKHGFHVRLRLNHGPLVNSCRPSVDVLFRSVAETIGGASIAVVLTGMGHDGLEGCRLIHGKGGKVIAQDQATSVVWGIPRAVAEAGLADQVLPLHSIAGELIRMSQVGRSAMASVC